MRREDRVLELKRLTKTAEKHREAQRAAWRTLSVHFTALVDAYTTYKSTVEAWSDLRESAAAAAGVEDVEAWRMGEGRFAVEPVPCDLGAVIDALLQVSCDPLGYGFRQVEGQRWDDHYELVALTPDLRDQVENVSVHRVERKYSTGQGALGVPWGRE
jgi:hypothetical protein